MNFSIYLRHNPHNIIIQIAYLFISQDNKISELLSVRDVNPLGIQYFQCYTRKSHKFSVILLYYIQDFK